MNKMKSSLTSIRGLEVLTPNLLINPVSQGSFAIIVGILIIKINVATKIKLLFSYFPPNLITTEGKTSKLMLSVVLLWTLI